VRCLDLPSLTPRGELFFPRETHVRSMTFGPSGLFFTGDSDGNLMVWRWT
jgi:hypothetical protein